MSSEEKKTRSTVTFTRSNTTKRVLCKYHELAVGTVFLLKSRSEMQGKWDAALFMKIDENNAAYMGGGVRYMNDDTFVYPVNINVEWDFVYKGV